MKKIWAFILKHKFRFALVVIAIGACGYWVYASYTKSAAAEVRYVLAPVEKGTIMTTVSGSGQISVTDQVELKANASGKLTYMNLTNGMEVKANQVVARVDASDALKAVRDASANLAAAKLSMQKLTEPADELSILQSENSLLAAQQTKQSAEENMTKAYEDAFNAVTNAFQDLPATMTGLDEILFGDTIGQSEITAGKGQQNTAALINTVDESDRDALGIIQKSAENDYNAARAKYDVNYGDYKNATRFSSNETIEALLTQTLETAKSVAQAAKSESNFLDTWADLRTEKSWVVFSKVKGYQSDLNSYISQTNGHVSSLLSITQTLKTNRESILSAERSIAEKTISLAKLKAGTDALDIKSQQISLQQKQNALYDAQQKLADYTVKAPFDGVIAAVNVKKGDEISSGTSIATLITKQQMAEISLNEVDVAKIKLDDKVTLTFDAVPDLSITGKVSEIDSLGTVSQGVVTYNIKIFFDTQDARIKPGMSVSASIITDIKQDVLMVANSSVKTFGATSYVEMLPNATAADAAVTAGITSTAAPTQQPVETGLANDTSTEIVSGLKEGDLIITRTINPSSTAAKTTTGTSLLQMGGATRTGGGRFRAPGM